MVRECTAVSASWNCRAFIADLHRAIASRTAGLAGLKPGGIITGDGTDDTAGGASPPPIQRMGKGMASAIASGVASGMARGMANGMTSGIAGGIGSEVACVWRDRVGKRGDGREGMA